MSRRTSFRMSPPSTCGTMTYLARGCFLHATTSDTCWVSAGRWTLTRFPARTSNGEGPLTRGIFRTGADMPARSRVCMRAMLILPVREDVCDQPTEFESRDRGRLEATDE